MTDKYDHVRQAKQTRPHTCHWPGCTQQVPPALWGCKPHWFKLPQKLRRRVWATYRAGQEETMTPSKQYMRVMEEIKEWIEEQIQRGRHHLV